MTYNPTSAKIGAVIIGLMSWQIYTLMDVMRNMMIPDPPPDQREVIHPEYDTSWLAKCEEEASKEIIRYRAVGKD